VQAAFWKQVKQEALSDEEKAAIQEALNIEN
jgi:hypothetical protein